MTNQALKADLGCIFYFVFGQNVPPGHEQEGKRPAIIISIPSQHGEPRFPMFIVAPLTTLKDQDWVDKSPNLYPIIKAKKDEIARDSIVLLDQIKAVDVFRVERYVGRLNQTDFQEIITRVKALFKKEDSN